METKDPRLHASHIDFKGLNHSKVGYFKQVRDKLKELENLSLQLGRRHRRLEAILDGMSDGLTILDHQLNIVFTNSVQQRLFPDVAMHPGKCHQLYHQRETPCSDCPALQTMNTQSMRRGEYYFKKGNLAGRYVEWTTTPVADPSGEVMEVLLMMRDITHRKHSEFQLMQTDRMASIGFLAAGIAHEINNPLASISGFSEALLKRLAHHHGSLDAQQESYFKEYLGIIHNEAYRCKDIIENLMEFSRNTSNEHQPVAIDRIIEATLALLRQHAKDNRIHVTFENHLIAGFNLIMGIEAQLKQLFLNVFKNILHPEWTCLNIPIWAKNRENKIEIQIQDDTGIFAEKLDGFSSAHIKRTDLQPKGYEIDLSIIYSILRNHRGQILCGDNAPSKGAITLRFPTLLP